MKPRLIKLPDRWQCVAALQRNQRKGTIMFLPLGSGGATWKEAWDRYAVSKNKWWGQAMVEAVMMQHNQNMITIIQNDHGDWECCGEGRVSVSVNPWSALNAWLAGGE